MALSFPLTMKIGLVLLVIGAAFFITGFSTAYWTEYEYPFTYINKYNDEFAGFTREHFGLWKRCYYMEWSRFDPLVDSHYNYDAGCYSWFSDEGRYNREIEGKLKGVQFCESMALVLAVISVIALLVSQMVEACANRKVGPLVAGVLAVLAGAFTSAGAIIFRTWDGSHDGLDWSFGVTVAGGVCFVIAGVVINVGALLGK